MRPHVLGFGLSVLLSSAAAAAPGDTSDARVVVLGADELAGREVVTREGEAVGRVEYVSLSLEQGRVSDLVIDTSGVAFPAAQDRATPDGDARRDPDRQPGDLMIVSWSRAGMSDDAERVVLHATAAQLAGAPQLQRGELARLAQPDVASYVVDYWSPTTELAALEGERRQEVVRTDAEPSAVGAGAQEQDQTLMLVGQEVVAAVTDPVMQLDERLRGSTVYDQAGTALGEIRRILIDPAAGAIAFAIIEGAGAAGDRLPVPVQALTWTAEDATRLRADAALLRPDTALTGEVQAVDRERLAELYRRFQVPAYW